MGLRSSGQGIRRVAVALAPTSRSGPLRELLTGPPLQSAGWAVPSEAACVSCSSLRGAENIAHAAGRSQLGGAGSSRGVARGRQVEGRGRAPATSHRPPARTPKRCVSSPSRHWAQDVALAGCPGRRSRRGKGWAAHGPCGACARRGAKAPPKGPAQSSCEVLGHPGPPGSVTPPRALTARRGWGPSYPEGAARGREGVVPETATAGTRAHVWSADYSRLRPLPGPSALMAPVRTDRGTDATQDPGASGASRPVAPERRFAERRQRPDACHLGGPEPGPALEVSSPTVRTRRPRPSFRRDDRTPTRRRRNVSRLARSESGPPLWSSTPKTESDERRRCPFPVLPAPRPRPYPRPRSSP